MWKKYDFFIAGVIQGSIAEKQVHAQDYRDEIKKVLAEKAPERSVFCPVEEHCNSVEYSDEEALQREDRPGGGGAKTGGDLLATPDALASGAGGLKGKIHQRALEVSAARPWGLADDTSLAPLC